jgi:cytochrome P450
MEFYEDPHLVYGRLRDEAPLYHNAERNIWALTRYEDVLAASRDYETFSSARGVDVVDFSYGPGDILDMDPPRHDELRRIVRDFFTPTGIRSLEGYITDRVDQLLLTLRSEGGGDLVHGFARRLPFSVICHLWGLPPEDHEQIEDWFVRMVERTPGQFEVPEDVDRAGSEMNDYIHRTLDRRRRSPTDDLLGALAVAVDNNLMSAEEINGLTRILLVAGIHTTETLIGNSLHLLADFPEERQALAERPETIPKAVEELLRWVSPVQWLTRTTTADVLLHETQMPAGSRVVLVFAAANRDERKFADADVLDLGREKNPHLAFGQGIHFCIGATLARLEARIAFTAFFQRVPRYRLSGRLERMFTGAERGFSCLPVEFFAT